ncbi:hypothetical protein BDZ85DRAFT_46358 [Elsinoe ampelina]|uniref:Uncharacterized protein n=1 Tax=Elsinoe ampelina TaxID=302913 RepID=A0A6A6G0V8_9PEZI|nr:hypothetical protein BDZ85DRAFT_46358 [Elsinoe ampelina]
MILAHVPQLHLFPSTHTMSDDDYRHGRSSDIIARWSQLARPSSRAPLTRPDESPQPIARIKRLCDGSPESALHHTRHLEVDERYDDCWAASTSTSNQTSVIAQSLTSHGNSIGRVLAGERGRIEVPGRLAGKGIPSCHAEGSKDHSRSPSSANSVPLQDCGTGIRTCRFSCSIPSAE